MAQVTSLGLHQPAGLQHAISEHLLPEDASPSAYTWDVFLDDTGANPVQDELLVTAKAVVWSRGNIFCKTFNFSVEKEDIRQALLTYFPTKTEDPVSTSASRPPTHTDTNNPINHKHVPKLARALVVFLKTQAHIFFLSGASHIVHMPFEVETARALPQGLLIQRKKQNDAAGGTAAGIRFPRVPPNSFTSSQPIFSLDPPTPTRPSFSVESLGKPATLPLRLGSTLGNMNQPSINAPLSHWPRLVTLLDPLLELGLVVVAAPEPVVADKRKAMLPLRPSCLDAAEEILDMHVVSSPQLRGCEPLLLAVTVNRESGAYSIWRVRYLPTVDAFIKTAKTTMPSKVDRRRSSMAPGYATSTSAAGGPSTDVKTPVRSGFRESFGVPLPGKRTRKATEKEKASYHHQQQQHQVNFVASLEKERDPVITRRQSKRLSSLARVDMPASQERSVFAESNQIKRLESFHNHGRLSGAHSYNQSIHPSLNSLLDVNVDSLLEDMRLGADFEASGLYNMGLQDHDFEGLAQELSFSKIKTIPVSNLTMASIGYSSGKAPASLPRIFNIVHPPSHSHRNGGISLMVVIQDSVEHQLDLVTLQFSRHARGAGSLDTLTLGGVEVRRAPGVVDSCKLVDGDVDMMLILSERHEGGLELSIQAPWSKPTTISIPVLIMDHLRSLQYVGQVKDNTALDSLSREAGLSINEITGFRPHQIAGVVDIIDKTGRMHQLSIRLQPTNRQVRAILDVCRVVIADAAGETIICGWWQVMQWVQTENINVADREWSALTILLLSMFLRLNTTATTLESSSSSSSHSHLRSKSGGRRQKASKQKPTNLQSNWSAMQMHVNPNAAAVSSWLTSPAWSWAFDSVVAASDNKAESFIATHIRYSTRFLASATGVMMLGPNGYLPTASGLHEERRLFAARNILVGIHLLVEEQKLDISIPETGPNSRAGTRVLLAQISRWMGWKALSTNSGYEMCIQEPLDAAFDNEVTLSMPVPCPEANLCVLTWIQNRLEGDRTATFPGLIDVLETAQAPSSSYSTNSALQEFAASLTPRTTQFRTFFNLLRPNASFADSVEAMYKAGFSTNVALETLPEAVLTTLKDPIAMCQAFPPSAWSKGLLMLVNRSDIGLLLDSRHGKRALQPQGQLRRQHNKAVSHAATWDMQLLCKNTEEGPGLAQEDTDAAAAQHQAIVRNLFRQDRRFNDALELMSTVRARTITLRPQPDWSESVYLEKQKDMVARVALSTLAIPAGRGLLYYGLRFPLPTQKTNIIGFNLNCIVKPVNVTVGVDRALFTEEKVCWSFFHQGAAAGLSISPKAQGIDNSWILYNKPGQDLSNRHAGFLLALGLNGHLTNVAKWVSFKYLTPKHNMTSIGLLLGLAASHLGTMDSLITRLLSVHVTRMLPRGSAELNLSPLTQTTGIMGIGLLYYNTQHRRMSEIMLSEILHSPELDGEADSEEAQANSDTLRSEGYRLAAGFALGFINLGRGADLKGLHDMDVTNRLLTVATAPKRVELVNVLDRSAAGAIMALALIHMKTEDALVARKVDVPDSIIQFDYVRPDLLLLRTVAKNVILWSQVQPTMEWICDSLPTAYHSRANLATTTRLTSSDLAFYSILGGLCFSIGLRYAGSGNLHARNLLVRFLDDFGRLLNISKGRSGIDLGVSCYDEELARHTLRTCQDITSLSAACVMAGSGDIMVLRRLRSLHGRTDPDIPYGSHMAAHMAIGLLFLGCGSMTLSKSNLATASLLVAFYPVFPATVMDNRAHLQAFRHLWVLGVESRCVVVRDVATAEVIGVPVSITLRPHAGLPARNNPRSTAELTEPPRPPTSETIVKTTPCLLPPLDEIASIRTHGGPTYWDTEIDLMANPNMASAFMETRTIHLRRRPAADAPFSDFASSPTSVQTDNLNPGPFASLSGGSTDDIASSGHLSWLFSLDGLKHLSSADRAMVLDTQAGSGDGAAGSLYPSPVDSRLELENTAGHSRDEMLGLRLLFQWGHVRDAIRMRELDKDPAGSGDPDLSNHEASRKQKEMEQAEWWVKDEVVQALKAQVIAGNL
ncbi:Negative regulator of mitosis [Ceratocystis lukuohia]|uniref:Negative regulator of mitosis n=1 Tax=Ceratocystis lukuohia TaxID=2019550 RepID=A0ABR4M9Y7_9PEZI